MLQSFHSSSDHNVALESAKRPRDFESETEDMNHKRIKLASGTNLHGSFKRIDEVEVS